MPLTHDHAAALLDPLRWLRVFVQIATGSEVGGQGARDPWDIQEEMDPDWDGDWEDEIEI